MSLALQRLGGAAHRHRRIVLGLWLTLLIALGTAAALSGGSFVRSFTVPGSQSQNAVDLLKQRLPAANGASGDLVFAAAPGKRITSAQQAAIRRTLAAVSVRKDVLIATDPFRTRAVSRDGRIAFSQVTFRVQQNELSDAARSAVVGATAVARSAGLQVGISGDMAAQVKPGSTEGLGVAVALVVLLVTFGSVVAAGMPLLTAGVGVGAGVLGILTLSALTSLDESVVTIAVMLGLAVGIDYALFIVSRHRAQVQAGMDLAGSIAHAVGTAGGAVVFAGSTVIVALAGLSVTGVPFLTLMGLCAAGTIALAVLVALTLVPALLGFAGTRATAGKTFEACADDVSAVTMGGRWAGFVTRHRAVTVGFAIVATLAMTIPALHMRLGLPDDSTASPGSSRHLAYQLLTEGFGPGFSGPLMVVAENPNTSSAAQSAATIRSDLLKLGDVTAVAPPSFSPDRTIAIIEVIPSSGPSTAATERLVRTVRSHAGAWRSATGARVLVTGRTALNIDVSQRMSQSMLPYLAVVVGLAFLLLVLAFRSLLVPLTAVAGFLLTIGSAIGAMVAVFQDGFAGAQFGISATAPIVSVIPILMIGILFGLAMDYEVFLVSRMHEEHALGVPHERAIVEGFHHSARVVTAAALIMVSVFSGFVLASDPIVKSVGFGLAAGVLVDAFIVRMTLMPALLSLLGERSWWLPRGLARLIPDLDIEGRSLSRASPAH